MDLNSESINFKDFRDQFESAHLNFNEYNSRLSQKSVNERAKEARNFFQSVTNPNPFVTNEFKIVVGFNPYRPKKLFVKMNSDINSQIPLNNYNQFSQEMLKSQGSQSVFVRSSNQYAVSQNSGKSYSQSERNITTMNFDKFVPFCASRDEYFQPRKSCTDLIKNTSRPTKITNEASLQSSSISQNQISSKTQIQFRNSQFQIENPPSQSQSLPISQSVSQSQDSMSFVRKTLKNLNDSYYVKNSAQLDKRRAKANTFKDLYPNQINLDKNSSNPIFSVDKTFKRRTFKKDQNTIDFHTKKGVTTFKFYTKESNKLVFLEKDFIPHVFSERNDNDCDTDSDQIRSANNYFSKELENCISQLMKMKRSQSLARTKSVDQPKLGLPRFNIREYKSREQQKKNFSILRK